MNLPELENNLNILQSLPNKPTLSAEDLKEEFDKAPNIIKDYINNTLLQAIENLIQNSINSSKTSLENSLTSTSTTKGLTAAMGKKLNDEKQKNISYGTAIPTEGVNGDIYLQYFDEQEE